MCVHNRAECNGEAPDSPPRVGCRPRGQGQGRPGNPRALTEHGDDGSPVRDVGGELVGLTLVHGDQTAGHAGIAVALLHARDLELVDHDALAGRRPRRVQLLAVQKPREGNHFTGA